ncbi:MAG: HU family DNA-binding protein [Akkermansia muciniphila]|nr:HU family DNA-binding protein [Akkermansia muciniphila]MCI7004940.1 HU family DNA-binding protein [Akkermansia muciniphila]MDD6814020.1 HU family DNA-binding protein [Akkermansia muciniphila]
MNKTQLIEAIQAELGEGATRKSAAKALDATLAAIRKAVVKEKVQIIGFGTFETRTRAAREGRNPATKEVITIPPCSYVAFKASTMLKEGL